MEKTNAKNVNANPCHACMPLGAILAFKGLEQSMVILHGSQGCSTYMRLTSINHFNEPVDIASSALNEKQTIYGGEPNLKKALDNVIRIYGPKVIGVFTTCLAETIGEDIQGMAARYIEEKGLTDVEIVAVNTPSYSLSHSEGFMAAVKGAVVHFAQETEPHDKINVIVPNISPADLRELKRLMDTMGVGYTLLPDFSDTMDRPYSRPYSKIPEGGTKLADIARMAGAPATIQFGLTVEDKDSPGHYLQEKFGVPLYNLALPIGIDSTDAFLAVLSEISGREISPSLRAERGRFLDGMIDSHKYNFEGVAALFGEPELVYGLSQLCLENGITPAVIATGTKSTRLAKLLQPHLAKLDQPAEFMDEADFVQIRQKCVEREVNLAIGHSGGKYLTEKEAIPLVRIGFPIHDRIGAQRILSVGYTGSMMFLDQITNTLLENKFNTYRQDLYNRYYRGTAIDESQPSEYLG